MNDALIIELHPDVIIDGKSYEVVSKVVDEHGVVWVDVEPCECRLQRISIMHEAGSNGRKQHHLSIE
jgi:hypothetical protein